MPQFTAQVFDQAADILKTNLVSIILLVAVILLPFHVIQQYVVARWLHPISEILQSQGDDADMFKMVMVAIGYAITGDPRHSIPGVASLFAAIIASAPIAVVPWHSCW